MTPIFKTVEDELFGDPSERDLAACVEALKPVVRNLRAKGLPANAIIAALAEVTTASIDSGWSH